MKVSFFNTLVVENLNDEQDVLQHPFIVLVDSFPIVIPKGFVTDYSSVPRLPLTYLVAGGIGDKAAVVHDFLYSSECPFFLAEKGRGYADNVFYYTLLSQGVSRWKAFLMWTAVRTFGWAAYKAEGV